jgi:hypothetical protein
MQLLNINKIQIQSKTQTTTTLKGKMEPAHFLRNLLSSIHHNKQTNNNSNKLQIHYDERETHIIRKSNLTYKINIKQIIKAHKIIL